MKKKCMVAVKVRPPGWPCVYWWNWEKPLMHLKKAHLAMGATPSWTCAPYQDGILPKPGTLVAWSESNAIVFANSVLGARTNRTGDLVDICCALTGRAPKAGLYIDENRNS